MASPWWAYWTTGVVVHEHRHFPVVSLTCFVGAHVAVPGSGVSTDLDPAGAAIVHGLSRLAAAQIPRRLPNSLSEVGVRWIGPRLLALDPSSNDILDGVQLSPRARACILRKILSLIDIRFV